MSGRSTLLRRGFNRSFIYSSYSIHGNLRPIVTGRHLHRWMKRYICGAVTQPGVVTAQGKTSKRPSSLLVRGPYRPLLSFSSFRRDPLSDSVAITGRHLHRQMKKAYLWGRHPARGRHTLREGYVRGRHPCSSEVSTDLRGPSRPLLSFSSFRRDPLSDSVAITGRHLHRQMKKAYLWGRHPARGRHTLREGYVRGRHPCSSEVSTDQVHIRGNTSR